MLSEELERLRAAPARLMEQRHLLLEMIEKATEARRDSADQLAQAENALREADRHLKEEEARLSEARESRIRTEAAIAQAQEAAANLTERIQERLSCSPEETFHISGLASEEELPDRHKIESQVEKA